MFFYKSVNRKGCEEIHDLYNIQSTQIIRHVKVKGANSPDNPDLREYWQRDSEVEIVSGSVV